jgi:hypothetical protein
MLYIMGTIMGPTLSKRKWIEEGMTLKTICFPSIRLAVYRFIAKKIQNRTTTIHTSVEFERLQSSLST